MHRSPAPARRRARLTSMALAAVLTIGLSSCVLTEGKEYIVQPAPPNGIHVTLKVGVSDKLKTVSDFVDRGNDIDRWLRDSGYDVRCNYYDDTVYYGDRCAFRVLRATQTDAGLAEPAVRIYWDDARAWDEFDDFRHDAVGPTRRRAGTCLHATIRNVGDWPVEWRDSNWTFRDRTDSKCR